MLSAGARDTADITIIQASTGSQNLVKIGRMLIFSPFTLGHRTAFAAVRFRFFAGRGFASGLLLVIRLVKSASFEYYTAAGT